MDHLEAIERLHRLKESGALSEEEFAAQKARLLADAETSAAAPAPAAPLYEPAPAAAPLNKGLVAGLGAAVLILGAGAWYALSGPGAGEAAATPSAAASDASAAVATEAPPALSTLPEKEQLRLASLAALGFSGSRTTKEGSQKVIVKAVRLLNLPFATVLLTTTERPDGCHACTGSVGVYYLTDAGGAYKVTGKWPEALKGWGWGAVPDWRLSNDYTSNPALVGEGSYTGQGFTCGGMNIVELTPKGPVESDLIATFASNEGAVDPDTGTDMAGNPLQVLEGQVVGVKRGRSLQVRVGGDGGFTESYEMRGGKFVRTSGETKLGC